MMKIKFRIWNTLKKKMYSTKEDLKFLSIDLVNGNVVGHTLVGLDREIVRFDLDEYILIQFTGMYDDEGTEIYDGDIVQGRVKEYVEGFLHADYTVMGEVFWNDVEGMWAIRDIPSGDVYPLYDYDCLDIIVGNIYANPELLEVH